MLLFEQAPELAYTAARGLAGCVAAFLALIVLNVLRQMVRVDLLTPTRDG